MIDFELGEDLELIQQTAREFAVDQLRPQLREHEAERGVSAAAQAAFAEIGFAGLELPEPLGGSGLGALARCVVLEELAAADPGAVLALDPLGMALYPLLELGGAESLAELGAPLLERPGSRAVLAWNGEGARGRLERRGGVAHGSVPWLPSDRVDLLIVLDEAGAFALSEGVSCKKLRGGGLRAAGASELSLEEAPVRAEWADAEGARRALARARLYLAALLVGVLRESAEYSRNYALQRVAFGKPIAHHQALAFLIADMASAVDSARVLLWDAAWRLDLGADAAEACASAFVEAAEQARFVTPNGVQILGGHGFMQDYPVEKFMREARALTQLLGGVDPARDSAGRELLGTPDRVALNLEGLQ
jgi:alkylation response protein AidB-like acyl-CoA dehydrogenase